MPTTISGTTGVSQIQDGVITDADINVSANITGSKLAANTITSTQLSANVVTADKVATGAVVRVTQFVKSNRQFYSSVISNTSVIPTVTTGAQVLSGSITPYTTTNQILVKSILNLTTIGAPNVWAMYFRNTTCIGATKVAPTGNNYGQQIVFEILDSPNSISEQIYQVRVATTDGSTVYINGWDSGELGGTLTVNGAYKTIITLTEIKG